MKELRRSPAEWKVDTASLERLEETAGKGRVKAERKC